MIIQTVACAHQHQRERDDEDRVVAKIRDYWMALQIVKEAFRENLTNQSDETEKRLDFIVKQSLVQFKSLAAEWNISKGAVSGWVKSLVEKGILIWCDKDGREYDNNADLNRAKRSGTAYIKVNEHYDFFGLPTPFELTGDSKWGEGGDLLELYDLKLNARDMDDIESSEEDSGIEDLFDEGFYPFGNGPDCKLSLEELVRENV
jgi:biotin operon repressor